MSGLHLLPDDFSGIVRLFPLPDLVMFPHVVQPLRVFEPRYIELLEDALEGDQLITMALLKPGWQVDYEGQPPVHPTVCVGRVISQSQQTDGCYNLLLAGVARGTIRREMGLERQYRRAEIELIADGDFPPNDETDEILRSRLLDSFWKLAPQVADDDSAVQQLLRSHVALNVLADVISFSAPLKLDDKRGLLSEASVLRRVEILVNRLQGLEAHESSEHSTLFPPDFSEN